MISKVFYPFYPATWLKIATQNFQNNLNPVHSSVICYHKACKVILQ